MKVYLVPVGKVHYKLYCEFVEQKPSDEGINSPAILSWFYERFSMLVRVASERHQYKHAISSCSQGKQRLSGRFRDRLLGWVGRVISEQRLLWHLRHQVDARLVYPDDLDNPGAMAIARGVLQEDFEHHRFWMIIDVVMSLILGPLLFFVPGPNLVAYYFCFRAVGHFLAMRGAKHGLTNVIWTSNADPVLAELRNLFSLSPTLRLECVRNVGSRLKLKGFVVFFERSMVQSS